MIGRIAVLQINRWTFVLLLMATMVVMLALNSVSAPLTTPVSPYGIVSYELAGNVERATQILSAWDSTTKLLAAFSLGLDYVFMLAYATTISLAVIWASRALEARQWPLASLGIPVAIAQWAAASLDAVENIALLRMLVSGPSLPWPVLAFWCAAFKFALIFAGLVIFFLGLAARYLSK